MYQRIKMTIIFMAAVLLFAVGAIAQDAKVVALSADEAAQAQALYARKAEIEKQISDLYDELDKKYIQSSHVYSSKYQIVLSGCKKISETQQVCTGSRAGWDWGFVYSEDFKYIVPKPRPPAIPVYNNCGGMATWGNTEVRFLNGEGGSQ
jgi:hypothetical protein